MFDTISNELALWAKALKHHPPAWGLVMIFASGAALATLMTKFIPALIVAGTGAGGHDAVFLAGIAAAVGITSPLLLSWMNERNRAKEKREDYARQDQVAERAEAARIQAQEAARLLVASNEVIAQTAREQGAKLEQIHVLVNSERTAGMERELLAVRATLLALDALAEVKIANGRKPTTGTLQQIASCNKQIAELEIQIADRKKQTVIADKVRANAETQAVKNEQADRIENTGNDTNVRAKNIETSVTDRVQAVEDNLDTKEDK